MERHSKFLSYLTGARYVLSAVSVLVVAQPSSEVPEGLTNYTVLRSNPQTQFKNVNKKVAAAKPV